MHNPIDHIAFETLQQWVENGRVDTLPPEMVTYLEQLEVARGLHMRWQSKSSVIKTLMAPPYSLSNYIAQQRYTDAINFFYADTHIKKEAYKNLYAERMESIIKAALEASKTTKDLETVFNMIDKLADLRQVNVPDKEELPEILFQKVVRVYTTNATKLGLPRANKHELGKFIDDLDITEVQKVGLKQDAELIEPNLFPDETES